MFERRPRTTYEETLLQKVNDYLSTGVRNPTTSPRHTMVVKSAQGLRIRDCSGNEDVDTTIAAFRSAIAELR
ncbi:MAG: hypothetical protein H6Q33_2128 [Deltaproteobacteria bacterium]|nr:hypothetical protein [Deltaproteobacteria bacterium]